MRHRNRILLQLLHGDRHRALQLRVMTVVHRFRVLLHFYIRRDTMVLHVPFAGRAEESEVGRCNYAAVHQGWILRDANQSAPGTLTHQRADVRLPSAEPDTVTVICWMSGSSERT